VTKQSCIGCQQRKTIRHFAIANPSRSSTKRRARCRKCEYALVKKRRQRNPHLTRERRRDVLRKYKYGLTPSQFEWLLDQQAHRCAICQEPLKGDKRGRIAIDHNHTNGAIRGILCYGCNWGLGHFVENPTRLRSAIRYLKRSAPKLPTNGIHPRVEERRPKQIARPDIAARNRACAGKPGRIQTETEKAKRRKPNPKVAAANRGRTLSAAHKDKIRVARLAHWARKCA
jgi:Recombination endonuclease VII